MDYHEYFLQVMKALVEVPSLSQDEEECARVLAGLLKVELGLDTSLIQIEGHSVNVNAVWRGKPGGKKKLLLGGHIDVVPPGDGWETDPFQLTIKDDRAYGRGTFDMKGGLAAQIAVIKKLKDEGFEPDGDIEIIGLCDEERLSIGAMAYVNSVRNHNQSNAFCIMAEPHFDNIVVGATGKVLLKLRVKGASGHAAEPETGVNAISCLSKMIALIDQKYMPLYENGRCASHSVLRVKSRWEGYSLNIPEEAEALLNKQLLLSENIDDFIDDLETIYASEVGCGELNVERALPFYPSYQLEEDEQGLLLLLSVLKEGFDHTPELRINQSVSDANVIYPELAVPTVLFGPNGANLHKPNEYIQLSSAFQYMEMLEAYIKEYFRY